MVCPLCARIMAAAQSEIHKCDEKDLAGMRLFSLALQGPDASRPVRVRPRIPGPFRPHARFHPLPVRAIAWPASRPAYLRSHPEAVFLDEPARISLRAATL